MKNYTYIYIYADKNLYINFLYILPNIILYNININY